MCHRPPSPSSSKSSFPLVYFNEHKIMNRFIWASRPEGRVFNNLTIPDTLEGRKELSRITGESLMDAAAKAGARVAIFDSKAQWYAFHETSISTKHPGLGGRDLVAELIEAGDRRGIVYVPYVPIDCDTRAFREHPEWRPRRANGTYQTETGGWPRLCQFAAKQWFSAYLSELTSNYNIGGIWLDGVSLPATPEYCYCDACVSEFVKRYGTQPPVSLEADTPEHWALWRDYRGDLLRETVATYARAVRAIKPEIPINCTFSWHNWQNGGYTGHVVECGTLWHESAWAWQSASVQYLRAVGNRPPESYLLASESWVITRAFLETKAMTCIANGGLPTMTLHGHIDTIRQVNEALAERSDYVLGAENVPYVGLMFSHESMHRCEPSPWADSSIYTTYGALRMLQEEKIPEHYLCDRDLSEEGESLDRFAVIVLPDVAYISSRAQENLRRYVERGGGLVALNRTSLHDAQGKRLNNFGLSDVFGVDYLGELEPKTSFAPWVGDLREGTEFPNSVNAVFLTLEHAHPIEADARIHESVCIEVVPEYLRGTPADRRLTYHGAMLKVSPHAGAIPLLREGIQEPGKEFPLITVRNFGRGRVVYFAADLGANYVDQCSRPYLRLLFGNAVCWAAAGKPQPFEVVNAPRSLQVNLYKQSDQHRTIVHFLNDPLPVGLPPFTKQTNEGKWLDWMRMREDVIPVSGVTLRIPGRFKKIYAVPGHQSLPVTWIDGYSEIGVPQIDIHLIVVAEE